MIFRGGKTNPLKTKQTTARVIAIAIGVVLVLAAIWVYFEQRMSASQGPSVAELEEAEATAENVRAAVANVLGVQATGSREPRLLEFDYDAAQRVLQISIKLDAWSFSADVIGAAMTTDVIRAILQHNLPWDRLRISCVREYASRDILGGNRKWDEVDMFGEWRREAFNEVDWNKFGDNSRIWKLAETSHLTAPPGQAATLPQ